MSFAEDNGYDQYDVDVEEAEERENGWQVGVHIDKNGKEHEISKMSDSHLLNTIKFFNGLDTSPLEEEAKKRNLTPTT